MYSQQQNKWYPQKCLLAHNNITICYYGQVNSLRLKLNVASKWASKHLWGVPIILLLTEHKSQ